ncbi:hypothetical protein LSH36_807g00115 [Paralvinella palmiformis]|uniref:Reticulocalbin-3 n=1 Tax=Paralvinella palmiformis TaxID=53620 RepID=A0AAD9IZN2_9ANNE|nr:hypothetical protein LSH36_807g00115 [Paralvinella palmiformis]
MKSHALLLALVASTLSSAIPKPEDEHKKRVVDKDLSDQPHFKGADEGAEHNPEYDHEAFLGREEAKTFDDLTPEESKERLGIIFDKIDKDKDGTVTEEELKDWITHVQNRYVWSDTERQWKEHEVTDGRLSWNEYKQKTYGDMINEDEETSDEDDSYSYKEMMNRDKRRWEKADKDGDGFLTKEEFADFLHPEDAEHMRDIVIQETIEDIDKDKDGYISIDEYIADLDQYDGDEDDDDDDYDDDKPEWLETEKKDFREVKDKNKDGRLDIKEVEQWIFPESEDYMVEEVHHLLAEADADQFQTHLLICDVLSLWCSGAYIDYCFHVWTTDSLPVLCVELVSVH